MANPHAVDSLWGDDKRQLKAPSSPSQRRFVSPRRPSASSPPANGETADAPSSFVVYVTTPSSPQPLSVTVRGSDTVRELKSAVFEATSLAPGSQQLLFNGIDMDAAKNALGQSMTLAEMRLCAGSTVRVVPRLSSGADTKTAPATIATSDIAQAVRQLSVKQLAALVTGREPVVLMARIGNQRIAVQIRLVPDSVIGNGSSQPGAATSIARASPGVAGNSPNSIINNAPANAPISHPANYHQGQPQTIPVMRAPTSHPLLSDAMDVDSVCESRAEQDRLRATITNLRQRMATNAHPAARRDPITTVVSGRVEKKTSAPSVLGASAPANSKTGGCATCSKKLNSVLRFKCRCGGEYCGSHKHAEDHACTFDYKSHGRQQLADMNPTVCASKINYL
eukprot:Opistho-2@3140